MDEVINPMDELIPGMVELMPRIAELKQAEAELRSAMVENRIHHSMLKLRLEVINEAQKLLYKQYYEALESVI